MEEGDGGKDLRQTNPSAGGREELTEEEGEGGGRKERWGPGLRWWWWWVGASERSAFVCFLAASPSYLLSSR